MKRMMCMILVLMLCMAAVAIADEPAVPEFTIGPKTIPQSEAQAFADQLRLGFNLGNCFDASDCNWLRDEMEYEKAWCGAKATEALMDVLKRNGFRTLRLPVSWHNHVDNETYAISQPWLNRVQEVVDWAIARDMYVILNIHHDNSKQFMYPSAQYREQSIRYVNTIWEQLAERFKDYDEHLIFESLNEPRLVGHNNEWWIADNKDCNEAIDIINELNQGFVNTVRASGSNNATRYLIVPGYDASPEGVLNKRFVLPTDPVTENDHHILLGVHAYTPYNFALEWPGVDHWSMNVASDKGNLVGFMENLYKTYVSKGQPVVLTEFGARDKNGNIAARTEFAAYYVASARTRGITCIWWDNNAFAGNGELFGIINRSTYKVTAPSIVKAMNRYADGAN